VPDSSQPPTRRVEPTGDQLARLLDQYVGPLVLYARQLCSDPEDAVQLAFIKLADQSTWPDDCGAWLYRVVRNEAIQQHRGTWRRQNREFHFAINRDAWFEPDPAAACDAQAATESLHRLTPYQREIVTARIWGGLAFREIAELVGVPLSTAHREYQQAILQLQAELDPSHVQIPFNGKPESL
jgi:RNA polymerase sigma factor (sigma-70 family)